MSTIRNRIVSAVLGSVFALACVSPALADDSEIYVTTNASVGIQPNILLIVDTSISMNAKDASGERTPYLPKGPKSGPYPDQDNCKAGRIFFRVAGDPQPDCSSNNWILADTAFNRCDKLIKAVSVVQDSGGKDIPGSGLSGRWTGKVAQYDATTQTWRDLQPKGLKEDIECAADDNIHGMDAASTAKHAVNGDSANRWSTDASRTIDWAQQKTYTFYNSSWLNWYRVNAPDQTLSRLDAVKQATTDLASSIDGVNLGLMRFNAQSGGGSSGGYVAAAVKDIDVGRADVITAVNGYSADSWTPLSETLWEAYQYYSGGAVDFGTKSVADSRSSTNTSNYQSPIIGQCQNNYIVYLTDGLATSDTEANGEDNGGPKGSGKSRIESKVGICAGPQINDPKLGATNDGLCFDDFAKYLHNNDVLGTMDDTQTITTYTIGFGTDNSTKDALSAVATAGGGGYYTADNSGKLEEVLTSIASDALNVSTTFTTASVGVSAFNRTQTRNELYFALFSPKDTVRWDGNLKKYKLAVDKSDTKNPKLIITGQDTASSAVDASTGRFVKGARSFWSTDADGNEVTAGGAANKLPAPGARKIYTFLGNNPKGVTADGGMTELKNSTTVTSAMLGTTTGTPTYQQLIDFAYAKDVKRMGDPLHSEPAVVTYDKKTDGTPIDVAYVATNDGYLHAIDTADGSGVEKWSFIPRELLTRLRTLYNNPATPNRTYGLDGDVRVLRLDKNDDGIIDPNDDRVWLFVGMRRGGRYLYALDVTRPDDPKMLWIDGYDDPDNLKYTTLPGLGETWSAPVITRAEISGATQNNQKLVLIFGGGYDPNQEGYKQTDDTIGNRIFMVDAKTGELLWYAAPDNTGVGATDSKRLTIADMKNSIPSRVTVLDTNGDLFADRMYVGDMGGRVLRFDIFNKNDAKTLVTGGVFAELGQGHVPVQDAKMVDTRRFYNAPDVALIQRRGEDPYYNIAIGSGYRGHPLNKETEDRFYSLRDKAPFAKHTTTDYNNLKRIHDDDTTLITIPSDATTASVPPSAEGWKLTLGANGQKVLAQSTTAGDVILFTTFEPADPSTTDPCRPRTLNRAYAMRVDNGHPALDLNNKDGITKDDLSQEVPMDGILGKVNIGVLRGSIADDLNSGEKPKGNPPTTCLAGMHILGSCVQVNDSVRTYWRRDVDLAP